MNMTTDEYMVPMCRFNCQTFKCVTIFLKFANRLGANQNTCLAVGKKNNEVQL